MGLKAPTERIDGLNRPRELLVALALGLLLLTGCNGVEGTVLMPSQDSALAKDVDSLYYFIFAVCVIYFVHIVGLMVLFVVRYRRKPGVVLQEGPGPHPALQIAWNAPPAVLVVIMFWWGFTGYLDMSTPPPNAYKIKCIASQDEFLYVYPNGVVETDLNVPPKTPVQIDLESVDVLHAFFVPKFRIKQDIVPGRTTKVWFEATRPSMQPGDYLVFCAEYCGTTHSTMGSNLFVHESRKAFDKWLADRLMPQTGERRTVLPNGVAGRVLNSGHLVFVRGGALWAVPFDQERFDIVGTPAPVVEGVQVEPGGAVQFAVADNGSLVYIPGGGGFLATRNLMWVDRDGGEEMLPTPPSSW